jgi:hypothetical protein
LQDIRLLQDLQLLTHLLKMKKKELMNLVLEGDGMGVALLAQTVCCAVLPLLQ